MTDRPLGRIGFEIELLAPRGKSRLDLATALAESHGGTVRRIFHPQAEQSKAANTPFFENLTLGFRVENEGGETIAHCVDDFTLQDDLEKKAAPVPGWFRVVSDDARFLRLAMLHADPEKPLSELLDPVADLFGVEVHHGTNGMVRVADSAGSPIVLGALLPGERERPCELISAPIEGDHFSKLESLLKPARELEFEIPAEAALHLHFDASPLCSASTIANLVRFLDQHGEALKSALKTNSRCRRLGGWPAGLIELVNQPAFASLNWEEAKTFLQQLKLTKYCDFNLRNIAFDVPGKHTFEVRILPVSRDAGEILGMAVVFHSILEWAKGEQGTLRDVPSDPVPFLDSIAKSNRVKSPT